MASKNANIISMVCTQESVPDPILPIIYMLAFGDIIKNRGIQFNIHADDNLLNIISVAY